MRMEERLPIVFSICIQDNVKATYGNNIIAE